MFVRFDDHFNRERSPILSRYLNCKAKVRWTRTVKASPTDQRTAGWSSYHHHHLQHKQHQHYHQHRRPRQHQQYHHCHNTAFVGIAILSQHQYHFQHHCLYHLFNCHESFNNFRILSFMSINAVFCKFCVPKTVGDCCQIWSRTKAPSNRQTTE